MHLHSALLMPILAIGVLANYRVNGTTYGVEPDLIAAPLKPGARVTNDVYEHCREINEAGEQVSTGEECFGNALQYMIQALSDAHNAEQTVALLSNTTSGVQSIALGTSNSTSTTPWSPEDTNPTATGLAEARLKQRDGDGTEEILQKMNEQMHRRSYDGPGPRAVQIGHSWVHSRGGLVVRTNVRSGDATLHVHTNGSHATAAFQANSPLSLDRRDGLAASASEYRFDAAQGLKLQIQVADGSAYGELSTLLSTLAHGHGDMAPKLKESDSWAFALCKKPTGDRALYGKLVMEDDGAGYDWEDEGLIDCAA